VIIQALQAYKDAYKGIGKPIWMLAVIQLINRSGSMVLPFLTVYMTTSLGYSAVQAGTIMSVFGIGSLIGSYLGGRFTDRFGPFPVQLGSLILGGLAYLILPFLIEFYLLAAGVFICALINDSLRPAILAMTTHFTTSENTTRSFSLLRMAINLGVAIGPAVAGMLAGVGYFWLFIGDGITCMAAGVVSYYYFRNRRPEHKAPTAAQTSSGSPYRNARFMFYMFLCFCYAAAFFQIFSGLPLYYKDVYGKTEHAIGLLLALNGLIVFVFEMITVSQIEKRFRPVQLVVIGTAMLGASFILLNAWHAPMALIVSMILLSFSEIFAMPFMISHVVKSSTQQTRGSYLAAYTIAWAVAFILSPYCSTMIIENYDYTALWWVVGIFCMLTAIGFSRTRSARPAEITPVTDQD